MNTLAKIAFGAIMLGILGGCAMASGGDAAVSGSIYSGYKSSGAVGNGTGNKTGEACASSILGIIGTGDASVSAAMEAGKLTAIHHVDHSNFAILGIYASTCTQVVGQ